MVLELTDEDYIEAYQDYCTKCERDNLGYCGECRWVDTDEPSMYV